MQKRNRVIAAMLLIYFIAGCAAMRTPYRQGCSLLKDGEYEGAIEKFELALRKMPKDVRAQCELGVTYYKKGDCAKAIFALNKAKAMDPKYGKIYLYLGLTYEKMSDPDRALSEYANYRKLGSISLMARKIKRRMRYIIKEQYAERIKRITEDEAALDTISIPENTIAVTYFENISGSKELAPLQKGLTDMLITDLAQVESLKVLERVRLNVLLEEMKLGTTGMIDKITASKTGRLLGANRIITGGFETLDKDNMRIDTFLVKTKKSQIEASADISGALRKIFDLEKELVFKIIDSMGIRLSPAEEDAIKKVPTRSLEAFVAYSRGLDYEDKGMYTEAAGEFKIAAGLDPSFSNAQAKKQEMKQEIVKPVTEELIDVEVLEKTQEQMEEQEMAAETIEPDLLNRLSQISKNTSEGLPQIEEGKRPIPQIDTNVVNIEVEWE